MTSHPAQLIIRQFSPGVEIPNYLVLAALFHRDAEELMRIADIVLDNRREGKNYITGVKVAIDSETHDAGGGFISPIFKNLGRVEVLPKEILEAHHLGDAELGGLGSGIGDRIRIDDWGFIQGLIIEDRRLGHDRPILEQMVEPGADEKHIARAIAPPIGSMGEDFADPVFWGELGNQRAEQAGHLATFEMTTFAGIVGAISIAIHRILYVPISIKELLDGIAPSTITDAITEDGFLIGREGGDNRLAFFKIGLIHNREI